MIRRGSSVRKNGWTLKHTKLTNFYVKQRSSPSPAHNFFSCYKWPYCHDTYKEFICFCFALTVLFFSPFVHLVPITKSPYNALWHLWSVLFTFRVHQTILWGIFDLQSFGDLSFGCVMMKWSCHVYTELYHHPSCTMLQCCVIIDFGLLLSGLGTW